MWLVEPLLYTALFLGSVRYEATKYATRKFGNYEIGNALAMHLINKVPRGWIWLGTRYPRGWIASERALIRGPPRRVFVSPPLSLFTER